MTTDELLHLTLTPTPSQSELDATFQSVDLAIPWWRSVTMILQKLRENEESALRPGLSNEDRQYGCGRLAAVMDLQALFLDAYIKAHDGT